MFLVGQELWDLISAENTEAVDMVVDAERSIIGHILNIVRICGSGVAIIMLTIMAIQYFTADGRKVPMIAEKKAIIKSTQLRNFAIGAIVFIGASNILYFVEQFVEQVFKDVFL